MKIFKSYILFFVFSVIFLLFAVNLSKNQKNFIYVVPKIKNFDVLRSNIGSYSIKPLNTDKVTKPSYQSSGDDIGDIVFSKPSSTQSTASYTSSSSMFPDKKVTTDEMEKEVREDPEKVAKAVRTMIAKDEKDDK